MGLFCTVVWRFWHMCNLVLHGSPNQDFLEVSYWCKNFLYEYHNCVDSRNLALPRNIHNRNSWRPSDLNFYKINYDAEVNASEGRVGFGVVIRDHTGFVLASCSRSVDACFDARMVEILAICRWVIFSKDCGLSPCTIESDATVVVKWINDGGHLESASGVILTDISLLISNLCVVSVKHVPRLANCVAHGVVKLVLTGIEDLFWIEATVLM
ncbi:hypothetical protein Dsin_002428 [Dipteronia sinensis]|uniref:RNase H type-1 domain-containing protein n=1 Tax=Dipteronia sinensis TaxID=43782 RepID=A0AAE0B735_9ROSI|nr:hypothetical protein Dsin_002428 [Dipteronia sinensis]